MNPSATLSTPEDPTPKGSHDVLPIHKTEPSPEGILIPAPEGDNG